MINMYFLLNMNKLIYMILFCYHFIFNLFFIHLLIV